MKPSLFAHWFIGLFLAPAVFSGSALAQPALGDALDSPGLIWTTGGNASWFGQTGLTHDGVDAAQSGFLFDNQEAWVQTTVTGPGVIAFTWKVSSEEAFDFLEFSLGGVLRTRISGEVDWRRQFFDIPAGSQNLRWRYSKDSATTLGQDRGWLDQVAYAPDSGSPAIVAPPDRRTVVAGVNVTFTVGAAGSRPLAYQWLFNATNRISGATGDSLTLTAVQLTNSGRYSVAVSNGLGSTVSSEAVLIVETNAPATNFLLFVDNSMANAYQAALNSRGLPYQIFADESAFGTALNNADPAVTLAIFDSTLSQYDFNGVLRFVKLGGRAIVNYWGIDNAPPLAEGFNAIIIQPVYTPMPVYDWGGSPLFTGVSNPLNLALNGAVQNGDWLDANAVGGTAVAGLTSAPRVQQAAIIIGNSGRTILHGFLLENATSFAEATRFAQNEIDLLAGSAPPRAPFFQSQPNSLTAILGTTARFQVSVAGTLPISYQWRRDGANISGATNASYTLSGVQFSNAATYSVVVSNAVDSATSSDAVLSVTTNGIATTTLVFVDGPLSSPYVTALQSLGRSYQLFSDPIAFNSIVGSSSPADSLVVVDSTFNRSDFSNVVSFVQAGGRVVLQDWALNPGSLLAAAFEVSVLDSYSSPLPVYDWLGSSLFSGLTNQLGFTDFGFNTDGFRLQPTNAGVAAAGLTATVAPNQAALVVGNSGRSIAHGFLIEEVYPAADGAQLAQNEIEFLTRPSLGPVLLVPPRDQKVRLGTTATFNVRVVSQAPARYQWSWNGTNLPTATNASLVITNAQLQHQGYYAVAISNAYGGFVSDPVSLAFLIPPVILQPPQAIMAQAGMDATFSVIVSNTATLPINYQWRKGSTPLTNILLNDYTCAFTLHHVTTNDAGQYRVVMTNAANVVPGIASGLATLTVVTSSFSPRFQSIAVSNGLATLSWSAQASRTYRVQYKTNFTDAAWNDLNGDVAASGESAEKQDTTLGDARQRFYRIVQLP